MPADFSVAAKNARVQIAVPPLDIDVIRERSAASSARVRWQRLATALAASLGIVGGAVALANIGGGVHLWFSGNNVKAVVESFTTVRDPMRADVQRIVSVATFPVKFPLLRAASEWIAYSPADKPNIITIEYRDSLGKHYAGITLIDNAKIQSDIREMPAGPAQALISKGTHWQTDGETVLVQSRHLTTAQVQQIKSAMQSETTAQSQSAFEAMLPRIVIMQVPPRVADAAGRVAPPGGNVLFGKWDIRQIPNLAAKARPLIDSRTVHLVNIPQVKGEPDFRDATLQWNGVIAIPADGVRAVAATLQRSHVGPNCNCAILVHASKGAYTIWKIDQKTLSVTRL
ncbi:MAG TPA: hypothetical protein VKT72_16355 [Candidatus Baltobacteraceae bacterium]|nr:hypothetical protein [Candidatus Baltobacteraceae bacterium]